MVDIQSPTAEIRRGKKKERKKIEITGQKYNGLPYYIGDHNDRVPAYFEHTKVRERCSQREISWIIN